LGVLDVLRAPNSPNFVDCYDEVFIISSLAPSEARSCAQGPLMNRNAASSPPTELSALDLRKIVDEREAARLRGISVDTLRRQSARGEGPARIQLSPRRVGYRLGDVLL
jgi:hypothetical protein